MPHCTALIPSFRIQRLEQTAKLLDVCISEACLPVRVGLVQSMGPWALSRTGAISQIARFFRSRQVSSASFACSCAGRNPPIRPVHRNPVVRVPAPRTSLANKTREKSEINRKPAWSSQDHPSHFSNISTFNCWKVRTLQSSQVCQGWIYPPNQDIPAFETFQPLVWARWWPGHVHPQLKSSKRSESSESFHCNF